MANTGCPERMIIIMDKLLLHPSIPFFAGAFLAIWLPNHLRKVVQLAIPFISWFCLQTFLNTTSSFHLQLFGYEFILIRTDALSLLFAYAFLVYTFFANLYSFHENEKYIHASANIYIGSSLGAVLAGDLVTLFVFWEIMALASTVLIWNKERSKSLGALFRYLLVHLAGGLLFFAGILIKILHHQTLNLGPFTLDSAGWLIFLGFAVNAAIVPIHAWLADAYPEATPAATVYLSAFTTKVAVYAFARCFAGSECLIWLGAVSAVYGVIFALMENDIRRLLSYHIVCQIGYMLCGIGLGTELGINAGTAHAVGNILFKGLLMMAAGSILWITGKSKLSDLGGLAKSQKLLLVFYMVGAFAIAGFPFLNGYVSKALLIKAVLKSHQEWLEFVLLWVAVGTFLSIALKLAYFAFWGERSEIKILRPVPVTMYAGMTGISLICLGMGLFPDLIYRFLPYPIHAQVYDPVHILHSLQLLAGTFLGFLFLVKGLHTKDVISLDLDWFYRKGAVFFVNQICSPIRGIQESVQKNLTEGIQRLAVWMRQIFPSQQISAVSHPLFMLVTMSILVGIVVLVSR